MCGADGPLARLGSTRSSWRGREGRAGIQGVTRRKRRGTTQRNPEAQSAGDLVNRAFTQTAPNWLWVADITYIPTGEGVLYLAVVVDAFSRRVVGWAIAKTDDLITKESRVIAADPQHGVQLKV